MQLTLWPGGWGEASWLCFDQQHCSFCRECGSLFDNFFVLLKSILQRWFSTFNTSLLVQGISLHDVNVLSPQRDKYDFRGPISTIWIFHLYLKLKLKSLSFKNTRMSEFRPRSKSQHCGLQALLGKNRGFLNHSHLLHCKSYYLPELVMHCVASSKTTICIIMVSPHWRCIAANILSFLPCQAPQSSSYLKFLKVRWEPCLLPRSSGIFKRRSLHAG